MNVSNYECSSGCESGWTTYLDQTSNSTDTYTRILVKNVSPDQEDEDLSMVSDASSGPPQFQEHENYAGGKNLQLFHGYDESSMPENKRKSKQNKSIAKELTRVKKQGSFCLDDTATSPLPHFAQDNLAPSGHLQEFSAEGEPITKNPSNLPQKGNQALCLEEKEAVTSGENNVNGMSVEFQGSL